MVFPAENLRTELLIDDAWTDVTSDVLSSSGIVITRGRRDETGRPVPSSMTLTLRDHGQDGGVVGKYVSRNPRSPFYGKLGRNTPIRQSIRPALTSGPGADASDSFNRTETNQWGFSTGGNGQGWSTFSVGSSTATDWTVSSSQGRHYVDAAVEARASYLADTSMIDGEILLTGFTAPQATGGDLEPAGVLYRGRDANTYGMVRVHLTTSNAVQVKAYRADSSAQIGSTYVTGITHTGTGQPLSMRVRLTGQTIWAKVWVTSGSEPAAYQVSFTDTSPILPGWVGVRSGRGSGNTNTANPQFSYESFAFTNELTRFTGEVAGWRPVADLTGRAVTVPIEAAGILRRLAGSDTPVQSPVRRYVEANIADVVGYWPMEEGRAAARWENVKAGGQPFVLDESVISGVDTSVVGSAPLPVQSLTPASVTVSTSSTGAIYCGFLLYVPPGGLTDGTELITIEQRGSSNVVRWEVEYLVPSTFKLRGFNASGVMTVEAGPGTFLDGSTPLIEGFVNRVAVELVQDGSNVDYALRVTTARGKNAALTGTFSSVSVTAPGRLVVNPAGDSAGAVMGHLILSTTDATVTQYGESFIGHPGEAASTRFARLCEENGVAYEVTTANTRQMGPQRVDTLYNLLRECEDADLGIMSEPREFAGLRYTARRNLYNQTPAAALTYSDGHLSDQLQPVEDDQTLINDLTVRQPVDGTEYRLQVESGPNNVNDPGTATGAVGRHPRTVDANVETADMLPEHAQWLTAFGTIDEDRIPQLTVDLVRDVFQDDHTLLYGAATADEGRIVTVDGLPEWLDPSTLVQMIRGYREVLSNSDRERGWRIVWNTSPGSLYTTGIYDAAVSRYDSASSSLTADIDDNDTSVSVTTTDPSDLWVTGAVDFDIKVNGEVMGVANISGATSPQTFTVVRAVNGISKSHSAGARVSLAVPSTYAL